MKETNDMPKNKMSCPGCGAETNPCAPPCDCGGDWWREPIWSRWPVQRPNADEPDGLDDELPF